jgi:ATP-binding cassette subfamily B protein
MSGYRLAYFGAIVFLGLAALAKTSTYFLLRYFVDNAFGPDATTRSLILIACGFVVLALFEGTFSFLSGRLTAQTAEGVAFRLRRFMFDHIQRLPFAYHDKTQTGELIQRSSSDVDALRRFYADQAIGMGRIMMLFGITFVALLLLNVRLAFVSVVFIPAIVLLSVFFFRRVSKAYEKYQEQEATLSTALQENLAGVRVVKAFARQEYERTKFEVENREKYRRGRRLLTMHSLYWPASDILCSAQLLLGYWVAAMMALDGLITVGDYIAYSGLVIWIIWPMRNLGRLIVQLSTGLVSFGRVIDVVSQEREPLSDGIGSVGAGSPCPVAGSPRPVAGSPRPVAGSPRPLAGPAVGDVRFDGVAFAYADDKPVLSEINLDARAGQAIALLGATGSGKTSLVNLLPRFYDYTGGVLTLDGVDLKEYSREYLRSQVGIVEQEPFLFSRTIKENIAYGAPDGVTDEQIEEAARAAAVHDAIAGFPNGYNTLVGERGITLSGGQKQRVAIARALLRDPRILILDDATSSVDMETEAAIREALARLMGGRTTFIIAHRIQSVVNADRILVLDHGRVVQNGTHEELLAQDGFYRRIYDLQARIEDELAEELATA